MVTVDIDTLHPNEFNTNQVSPENEKKLEESLKRFGVYKPIVCRELNNDVLEIIGGEHRWKAAKRLGLKTVPVVNLGRVSNARAKEIMLVDNGRYGEDDTLKLAELLKDIGNTDEIMSFMPMSEEELETIFASSSIALDDLDSSDDDLPDLSSITKKVQSHQIMRFKIPVEDCDSIQRMIEATMKTQGFTTEDSLSNAGNALVHLFKSIK